MALFQEVKLSAEPGTIRAFVALRLNAETTEAIVQFVEELRRHSRSVRWVQSANLHLTLRFLGGHVELRLLQGLEPALNSVAARTAPFSLAVRGTGAFPNLDHPRVIWVGLVSTELLRLAAQVEVAVRQGGFGAEARAYSPHLTIGRVADRRGWEPVHNALLEAADHDFGSSLISRMILYRSVLGRAAPSYHELASYPLTGGLAG